jgi:putative ABC transport system permease protein
MLVVEDARYREVETPRFDLYLPYRQAPNQVKHFMVRLSGDPLAIVPALRSAVAARDPEARVDGISTMEEIVGRAFAPWRFSSIVVSAFAAIALTFAAVGIATLVTFAVTQRTREIGVRVALGAQTRDVVLLVASEGAWIALGGLAIGVLAAWILRRSVESMLFGVPPDDALTLAGVPLPLATVSVLSAYLPARRAARIDPVAALRTE